jgi:tetratricopeptide (TPR) repeat protein
VDPQFRLDARNIDAVTEICRRLDGLPLAIELAASRVRLLPPLVLLARLHDGLGLVGVGPSDAPDRQRTLHDTITWSYDLLTSEEQRVLATLAVFSGGFDLDAVQALHRRPGGPDPLLTLGSLVDKSLVRALVEDGRPRFGLLETIREYALARLRDSGGWERTRTAHALHYRDVAESAGRGLRQQEQRRWLRRLETEHDNLRAALSWDLERADAESALRIGWGIWIFWWFRHIDEGARWFESISAETGSITPYQRAQALTGAGLMGFARSDLSRAEDALQQSLTLYHEVGDRPGVALASGALGHLATRRGDYDRASELLRVSLDLYRDLGDDWYAAIMLNFLGAVSQSRSDHGRAAEVFAEALALSRQVGGSVPLLMSLYNCAVTDLARGDTASATALFSEGLDRAVDIGDRAGAAPYLSGLAASIEQRRPERAARLQGAADGLLRTTAGAVWLDAYTAHPPGYRATVGPAERRAAGPAGVTTALTRAWKQGKDIGARTSPADMTRLTRLAAGQITVAAQ